jgi:hypothetical protein
MIAAAEVGNWRISGVIKEDLPHIATRDFEEASARIPNCIYWISATTPSWSAAGPWYR